MDRIVPITDLQRQAGQIVSELAESDEPVIVTQRGRPAAVLISTARYAEIEADLDRLDELEIMDLVARSRAAVIAGNTMGHEEVKKRLASAGPSETVPRGRRR